MSPAPSNPLISFCLIAFNQEAFIREAVASAFEQNYSPLEIILSDDCSTDATFAILSSLAAAYQGPHKVVVNQNPRNVGLGAHVNRIMELSQGALVVIAAGDDISEPERCTEIAKEWVLHGMRPTSLHSDFVVINAEGEALDPPLRQSTYAGRRDKGISALIDYLNQKHPVYYLHGASHAWSRSLFRTFGPLSEKVFYEDKTIALRSLLAGEFAYVPKKLVRYRMHASNLYGRSHSKKPGFAHLRQTLTQSERTTAYWLHVLDQYAADLRLALASQLIEPDECAEVLSHLHSLRSYKTHTLAVYRGSTLNAPFHLACAFVLRPEIPAALRLLKHWLFRTACILRLIPRA